MGIENLIFRPQNLLIVQCMCKLIIYFRTAQFLITLNILLRTLILPKTVGLTTIDNPLVSSILNSLYIIITIIIKRCLIKI